MRNLRRARLLSVVALLALTGCLMPSTGTPVFIDMRAGGFWSGRGMLLEVTPNQQRCRVAVRDRALIVRRVWTDCTRIHPR